MAFCKGAMSAIRKIWDSITPELETIIEEVTKYTKIIKDLEANPVVAMVVGLIPGGTKIEGWINVALDEITGVTGSVKTLEEKITEWLNTFTSVKDKNAGVFKLASLASKIADVQEGNKEKPESFYDSAVQLHIIVEKG